MNDVADKANRLRTAILADVGGASAVVCLVPDWPPVDLSEGLRWATSSVQEGFYVAYRVDQDAQPVVVEFKQWEFGEDEPPWSIELIPRT